ncbi:PTS sugar transporter subunit IIC [Lentilactobacillus buchneri]|nr:PTS sugar transporter subunit IIC [Lentilactobacillus sp. Egmn17]
MGTPAAAYFSTRLSGSKVWPAASAVAFGTQVGAIIIPLGLGINILMLLTKTTQTLNIDLWNYWHFAFIGSIVSIATRSFLWGVFAATITIIVTLVGADRSQKKVEEFYGEDLKGVSLPQAFCVSFIPFAIAVNWIVERIPGLNKVDFDAKKLEKRFQLGIILSAVMVLIPKITGMFIEGLNPISTRSQELVSKKFKGRAFNIGMTPALVIGHPTTLVVSLLLVPTILFLSVIVPGNEFLPLASLSGLIYIFPLVLPYTKGNVLRSFLVGLVSLVAGVLSATALASIFTSAVRMVQSNLIPAGTSSVASIDFAASPLAWIVYEFTANLTLVGPIVIAVITLGLMVWNRKKIAANDVQKSVKEPAAVHSETTN